ncbi:MAG TPA: type II toxin-antitoxin system death-on-curing family toxin [Candidatus Nanoarchaeia archaeon]
MRYLTPQNVIQIHHEIIDETGGLHGVRDAGLVESAMERPRAVFAGKDLYPNIFLKAAALTHSLLMNHPFLDGNKRTAVVAMMEFLQLNGKDLKCDQQEVIDFALWIENKKPSVEQIAEWIKKHTA